MLPVIVLIGLIALTISLFGVSATDGPLQVALLLSSAFASLIAFKERLQLGYDRRRGNRRVATAMSADLIGTWNMAGTIPTVVDYSRLVCSAASSSGVGSSLRYCRALSRTRGP
jgi:Na+:H+ antiporter, NhaC family